MSTSIAYTLDSDTKKSPTASLAKNGKYEVKNLSATSITFYCMGITSKTRLYVNYLSVTYTSASSVTSPTISPDSKTFETSQEVTITPAEGTTVYYTTNGNDPDNTLTPHTEVVTFTVNSTTTVKAIAYKEAEASDIVSATYTKTLPAPTFAYSSESVTLNIGEPFTAPTLTNTSDGKVTYSSSNTSLATVTADGTVTLVENASGTTTITASVSETANYGAATTSYTLTVIDPNVPTNSYTFNGAETPIATNSTYKTYTGNGPEYNGTTVTWTVTCGNKSTSTPLGLWLGSNKADNMILPSAYTNIATALNIENKKIAALISNTAFKNICKVSIDYSGTKNPIILYLVYTTDNGKTYQQAGESYEKPEGAGSVQFNFGVIPSAKYAIVVTTTSQYANIRVPIITFYESSSPISTSDANGAMTLSGAWTADAITNLALDETVTSVDMTNIDMEAIPTTIGNPNCLLYAKAGTALEDLNIIGGDAAVIGIELQDGYNFYNVKEFTGDITYSRTFAEGWNTFALPFNATITADDQIEEFDRIDDSGKKILFKKATSIIANTPYLINIATAGEKTFSANNVTVPVTATTGSVYKNNFCKLTGDKIAGKYILVLENGKEVFAPATTEATLPAFRGYLELAQPTGMRYSISHDQGGATDIEAANNEGIKLYTENGILNIHTEVAQSVLIRSIDGRTIQSIRLAKDANTRINGLAKGIYFVNHQKVIIK